ncbi:MAG: hypothetical protein HYS37_08015 [Candidatus Rokubacteria bacterium]|nr:hypothetical protein [Candidatus Rokubacteria bacterium]
MIKTTQLVLPLKSRPGVLAKVCRALAEVRLGNKPGALGRLAARLAKSRKNIKTCYASTAGPRAAVVLTLS